MPIRITVKGLAKYIDGTPAQQRRVLQDFKYPDTDEPAAMRQYYQDATNAVRAFHRNGHDRVRLREQAQTLSARAREADGATATRLRNNARGLMQYEQHFGGRELHVQPSTRMRLDFGEVQIALNPELSVTERGRPKLMKLSFANEEPSEIEVRVIVQCLYEAANRQLGEFPGNAVLFLDVPRGIEHRGARAGARTLREIEAACETISGIWPQIQAPVRRRRSG
jgi:hypothetical protein